MPVCASGQIWDPNANYRIFTAYGYTTHIDLKDYLAPGVTGAQFNWTSCDASRDDYYSAVSLVHSEMSLTSNSSGHVHGSSTQRDTVCTMYAAVGVNAETKAFRFYIPSSRRPSPLPPTYLSQSASYAFSVDIQVALSSPDYVYLGVQKADGSGAKTYMVAHGVTRSSVLTVAGLDPETQYRVAVLRMSHASFDLHRAGKSGPAGTLIPAIVPERKWLRNLSNSGLGKGSAILVSTDIAPPPSPGGQGPPQEDSPPPRITAVSKPILSEAGAVLGLNAVNCRVPHVLDEAHAEAGILQRAPDRARLMLSEGDAEEEGERAVWGCADYTHFEGGDEQAVSWDGDTFEVALGIEARLSADVRAGLAVSRSISSFDYVDRTGTGEVRGEYDLRLTGVEPYLVCHVTPELDLWAMLGYGEGRVEMREDATEGKQRGDATMRSGRVGASKLLLLSNPDDKSGTTKLVLRGEAYRARLKLEDGDMGAPLDVDIEQLRLGLEASHTCRPDADGATLKRWLELSARQDGGDAGTSDGVEIGGGVRYINPTSGWTLSAQARTLLEHERSRYEEYGATLVARKEPERDGRGLSLLLSSQWGILHEEGADWRGKGQPTGTEAPALQTDLSLVGRVGYGVWWPASRSLITWFGEFEQVGGDLVCLRLGANFAHRRTAVGGLTFAVFGEHGLAGVCPQRGIRAETELIF